MGRGSGLAAFAIAGAGALAGAWLGFDAVEGLLAIFTTALGAALGANFVLIALDMVRDWSQRTASRGRVPVPGRERLRGV